MNTDLREVFEAGLGPEPVLPPAHARLAAGRQALRRRRIVSCSVGAAVVAFVTLGVMQLGPNSPTSAPPIPPADNTVTPDTRNDQEARLTSAAPVDDGWLKKCGRGGQPTCKAYAEGSAPVAIQADGTLTRLTADVVIMRRAEDRITADGRREVEVELRTRNYPQPCWYVLTRDPSGKVRVRSADPASSNIDFETWVAAVRSGTDDPGAPSLVPERMLVND